MDDKIYELMAQAEILQEHALELQNKASEATSGIFKALDQVKRKLLFTALLSACIWVIFGLLFFLAVWFFTEWSTDSLRDERTALKWEISDLQGKVEKLRKEVQSEEKKLAEVQIWGIELVKNKGKRWIKFGKGDQAGEEVEWKSEGRSGVEVIRKK